jgi:hypothetical protein
VLVYLFALEEDLVRAFEDRIVGATIAALLGVLAISFLSSLRELFGENRGELISARVTRKQMSFLQEKIDSLEKLVLGIRQEITQNQGRTAPTKLLEDLLETKIRPLSRELWLREEKQLRGFRRKELLRSAVFDQKYPGLLMGVVLLVVTPNFLGVLTRFDSSTLLLAAQVAMFAICFYGLNFLKILKKPSVVISFSLALVIVVAVLISFTLPQVITEETPENAPYTFAFLIIFILNLAILSGSISSLLKTGFLQAGELSEEQGRRTQASYKEIDNLFIGRELAGLLHGKIQNEISLALANIEAGAELESQMLEVQQSISQLRKILNHGVNATPKSIIDYWSPFLKVSIVGTEELRKSQARVIDEAICNAFRHGKAAQVFVRVVPEKGTITVWDDGFGPLNGKVGLGSLIFSSLGDWEINAGPDGGSVLEIRESIRRD